MKSVQAKRSKKRLCSQSNQLILIFRLRKSLYTRSNLKSVRAWVTFQRFSQWIWHRLLLFRLNNKTLWKDQKRNKVHKLYSSNCYIFHNLSIKSSIFQQMSPFSRLRVMRLFSWKVQKLTLWTFMNICWNLLKFKPVKTYFSFTTYNG